MLVLVATLLLFPGGCGGIGAPSSTQEPTTERAATPAPKLEPTSDRTTSVPCASGGLTVGDLPVMDSLVAEGLAQMEAKATAWQSDARLTSLRVGCELLEPGFRWQATYFSDRAQAFYAADTGESFPAEVDPALVPDLPAEQLSFGLVRRSLAKAGYADDTPLSASVGIDIRVNTAGMPFGPPEAPDGVILYHVAIELRGEVKDLFISNRDGAIYRYTIG